MDKVVLIGSGRVASSLAHALDRLSSIRLIQIYSRTYAHACTLANHLSQPAMAIDTLEQIDQDADYYIFAVSDGALPSLWDTMPATRGVWIHTAGSVPLEQMCMHHRESGVIYPLQTFSHGRHIDWKSIALYVEGDERVRELAERLSTHTTHADSEQRGRLHLAAVLACNFTNHLIDLAERFLQDSGLDPKALLPLIDETIAKLHEQSAHEAQTGPAVRGDHPTEARHLAILADAPALAELYKRISASIVAHR